MIHFWPSLNLSYKNNSFVFGSNLHVRTYLSKKYHWKMKIFSDEIPIYPMQCFAPPRPAHLLPRPEKFSFWSAPPHFVEKEAAPRIPARFPKETGWCFLCVCSPDFVKVFPLFIQQSPRNPCAFIFSLESPLEPLAKMICHVQRPV